MRRFLLVATLLLLAGATGAVHAQRQFQLFATFVDASGAPAASVDPASLQVAENDQEAKVVKVEPLNWPLKLQLLLDNGVGLGGENLIHLRNGVRALLEGLPDGVEVTIVTTAPQPRFVVRATTDRKALLEGVDRLTPDTGAGRFVESLNEATQRIERDKSDYFPVIISLGTTSGDTNVMERDIERLMRRLEQRPTTVHVVMFSAGVGRTAGGGANQTQVGIAVTKFTQGRYENITAASRIATLLPELGAEAAKVHGGQGGRFRLTVERPAGASGNLGRITLGTRGGLVATSLSMAGR